MVLIEEKNEKPREMSEKERSDWIEHIQLLKKFEDLTIEHFNLDDDHFSDNYLGSKQLAKRLGLHQYTHSYDDDNRLNHESY